MSTAPERLASLRQQLAGRFPTVPCTTGPFDGLRANRVLPTGIPALDHATGGLPFGAVTEIVCTGPSCGGHLLLGQLLTVTRATRTRVALIDSTDSFDPASFPEDLLAHLVWVRCANTVAALNAADLLTRDANLGLVVLDLRRAPLADLRRTPTNQWYRLQRAVEPADLALVVETPHATVPSAQLRFELATLHTVNALDRERSFLTAELAPKLQRQRLQAASAG
ncbi:MAG: hypothetical protein EXS37_14435 [Opitutus sp.]|nr:hypothetical protein [Opitutus sp.]